MPSKVPVIDFDYVEHELAKGCRSSMPSCDGVTLNYNRSVFCFVEIKGWGVFVARNIVDENQLSDEEKKRIDKQTDSFNLKGKLMQSIKDCEEITGQVNLFSGISYAYVIVTDINSETAALEDLVTNLATLAETASVWNYCDEKMKEKLSNVDIAIKKVYTHCGDFDTIINTIGFKA